MSSSRFFLALALVLLLVLAGCRNDAPTGEVDKPIAPSMQATIDAYGAPNGWLDAAGVLELVASVAQRTTVIDSLVIDVRVLDAARSAIAQLNQQVGVQGPSMVFPQAARQALIADEDVAVSSQALTVAGEGFLVVTRICDGWDVVPIANLANGTMELTVGFTERGVDPVMWGSLALCKYRLNEHFVQLDGRSFDRSRGDVRVYIGNNVTTMTFGTFVEPVLVELEAQVILDGMEVAGLLSFQIDVNTRALALLVPLVSGNVVVSLDAARASTVVRAGNGTFACDLVAQRCTAPDGSSIGAP
jgi:hypothetical protein